ncbi:MAG: TIGR03086 family metal-binding protein [Actinomycetota bacterium]|nr:TIGR03086 family metal-binding protein [Actinomycetota bacterium]
MTETATTTSAVNDGQLPAGDPRVPFAQAVDVARRVIAGVQPDQFGLPTPCHDLEVRGVVGHMVSVIRRVAGVGRGEDPFSSAFLIEGMTDNAEDWVRLWSDGAHDVQEVWSQEGILERQLRLPFATLPGAVAIAIYTSEVTVHTWDLATATDQRPEWDESVLAVSLATMERALPAEPRGDGVPFGPVVAVGTDAPLIDRLVAWTGRQP